MHTWSKNCSIDRRTCTYDSALGSKEAIENSWSSTLWSIELWSQLAQFKSTFTDVTYNLQWDWSMHEVTCLFTCMNRPRLLPYCPEFSLALRQNLFQSIYVCTTLFLCQITNRTNYLRSLGISNAPGIGVRARLQMRFEPRLPGRHDLSTPIAHPHCFCQNLVVVGNTRATRLLCMKL